MSKVKVISDNEGNKVVQDDKGKATHVVVDGKTYNVRDLKK